MCLCPNRTDNTEKTGTKTTNDSKILRKCSCGWSKVTSYRGLRIHQGKAKCGGITHLQTCTASADETRRTLSPVEHHSAVESTIVDGEREEPHQPSLQEEQQQEHAPMPGMHLEPASSQPTSNPPRENPTRQAKVRWPKNIDKEAWRCFDQNLHLTLQYSLKGSTTSKLNLLGNIIYEEGKQSFGEMPKKKPTTKQKGRREREIFQLVKERRLLRKAWRKAQDLEKEALKCLWDQLKSRLANLRRAERIRKRRSRKEKARTSFFRDPFKYARDLLEEKKSGKLETTAEELESHIKEQLGDSDQNTPLGSPGHVPCPPEPGTKFDTTPPRWAEINQVVQKARTASAPGPNGVPYKVFKNCPMVLKLLWKLMRAAWKTQSIPLAWSTAATTFIPKVKDSHNITQFRGISLLNVEGKIFFSVMARRMTSYLLANNYIDTSCQKAGVPGFPGCVEHSAMIWEQIQTAKRRKLDLHVVWLDLANAYGSVPHQLITFALNFFHIPTCIKNLVSAYFNNFYAFYTTQEITTSWQQLQKGIAMGCSISPILFTAAFEVILIGARQMVRGVRSESGQRLPALRSYMDDVTSLLQTAACTSRLLKRLEELLNWARMKIKPAKSRSLSIRKGSRNDNIVFAVDGEKIPLLTEQSVRSLGREYTADLSDKHMAHSVITQLSEGLVKIDESHLPGKFKTWCYQFTLYHRLMWPLKLSEISASTVQRMDQKANNYIRKWLGLPRCLSNVALFGRNTLQLPLKSISLGYKLEKVRLVFELRDSTDPVVSQARPAVRTGRKWRAEQAVDQAISQLEHQEVVGWLQQGKTGLGWGPAPKMWSKAKRKERKELVVSEVSRMEDEAYTIRAVSQRQQGKWTNWEAVTTRAITWADMWKIPQARLSFLIRSTYDTLPSPQNIHLWYGTETICSLCDVQNPNLKHILTGCKPALAQGRYGWRHDQVLQKLAEVLEERRLEVNRARTSTTKQQISFIRQGGKTGNIIQREWSVLKHGCEWQMRVDLKPQLKFPPEITTTSLRPDIVLWSIPAKTVIMAELTVPWEENMEAAFERKKDKYSELAAACREAGWKAFTYPGEVGCRGFIGKSTQHLLKALGITGSKQRKALKELAEEAEKGSFWLWLRRKDPKWGNQGS